MRPVRRCPVLCPLFSVLCHFPTPRFLTSCLVETRDTPVGTIRNDRQSLRYSKGLIVQLCLGQFVDRDCRVGLRAAKTG